MESLFLASTDAAGDDDDDDADAHDVRWAPEPELLEQAARMPPCWRLAALDTANFDA